MWPSQQPVNWMPLLIFVIKRLKRMNIELNRNEDAIKLTLSEMKQRLSKIHEGGGKKAIEKQREKNKLTARERISYLIDNEKPFIEIGAFAGYEMYKEEGGCP